VKKVLAGIVTFVLVTTSVFAEWKVFQDKDLMSEETVTIIYQESENKITNIIGAETRAVLAVRCVDNKFSGVWVFWDNFIDKKNARKVMVKWDKNKPSHEAAFPSKKKNSTFFAEKEKIAENMKKHNKVVIRAYPWNSSPVTAEFNLAGFTKNYNQYCK